MTAAVLVFCVLDVLVAFAMFRLLAGMINAHVVNHGAARRAERELASVRHLAAREVIIQHELAIWNSVPAELLPALITHTTQEDFDD